MRLSVPLTLADENVSGGVDYYARYPTEMI